MSDLFNNSYEKVNPISKTPLRYEVEFLKILHLIILSLVLIYQDLMPAF